MPKGRTSKIKKTNIIALHCEEEVKNEALKDTTITDIANCNSTTLKLLSIFHNLTTLMVMKRMIKPTEVVCALNYDNNPMTHMTLNITLKRFHGQTSGVGNKTMRMEMPKFLELTKDIQQFDELRRKYADYLSKIKQS